MAATVNQKPLSSRLRFSGSCLGEHPIISVSPMQETEQGNQRVSSSLLASEGRVSKRLGKARVGADFSLGGSVLKRGKLMGCVD